MVLTKKKFTVSISSRPELLRCYQRNGRFQQMLLGGTAHWLWVQLGVGGFLGWGTLRRYNSKWPCFRKVWSRHHPKGKKSIQGGWCFEWDIPGGSLDKITGHHIQYKEFDQMVVSRDILVIYAPSLRDRWELTQMALFFHARQRLQGEPRRRLSEEIRRALEPYWMRVNSREETCMERRRFQEQIAPPWLMINISINSNRSHFSFTIPTTSSTPPLLAISQLLR